jgi:hypothetical protein
MMGQNDGGQILMVSQKVIPEAVFVGNPACKALK